ncbi:MAG TPA: hypothetical protein VIH55_07075 [Acidimicrobiia bacterium]
MNREVVIDRRFRGPPRSANGGYACGVIAEGVTGVATVSLRLPPPLETTLTLSGDGLTSRLTDGERLVGEASSSTLEIEVPGVPTFEVAQESSRGYSGFIEHIFEGCFVCGPARDPGDGLRIFAGPVAGSDVVAAPWSPDQSLRGPDCMIDRRHVWAALDCPSYFGIGTDPKALLGRLTADIDRLPEIDEPLVVIGWPIDVDGRKFYSGSALADANGDVLARAAATWIEIDELPV